MKYRIVAHSNFEGEFIRFDIESKRGWWTPWRFRSGNFRTLKVARTYVKDLKKVEIAKTEVVKDDE